MTTTQDLIVQLRALGTPDWATARWLMGEAADRLEALQAEVERRGVVLLLAGLYPDCTKEDAKQRFADYESLQNERDQAQYKVVALQAEVARKSDALQKLWKERDAALARLAELSKQEPVSYRYRFLHPISGHPVWRNESTTWNGQCVQEAQPLFASAGASPEPSALQDENAKLITALAACRDAFPVPDAGSRLDDWYCSAMADPLAVPEYVGMCVAGASPVEPSQAGELSKEELTDLIAAGLGGTYHCTRVWSAWSFGTMSQDDFEPVDESDTPAEIVDAVIAAINAKEQS